MCLKQFKGEHMGNLPCPMPADYKHRHSHLIFAIKHGKNVAWIEGEIAKLRKWSESKGVLRLSWDSTLTWWLRKAILFEQEREAGRRGYDQSRDNLVRDSGVHRIGSGESNGVGAVGELARKIETYRTWLKANPKLAQEYLERQPERVRRAILERS